MVVCTDIYIYRMYHAEFWHGTADDTVYHACELIVKNKLRFLPIMNPEENLMLSVLSQIDILGRSHQTNDLLSSLLCSMALPMH